MATMIGGLASTRPQQKTEIQPENYRFLQDYIYRESGIVIDADKHYLLEARLAPVARKQQVDTLNDLCNLLRATSARGELRQQVVEAMTTHETLFFRDLAQYDAVRTAILPPLIEQRKHTRQLSFWSAAASSGQEVYSLAMMLLEMGLGDWRINILATDLSEQILDRAREGRFMQIEVNRGLPVSYLVKYFTRQGLDWQLKENVRRMVRFQKFDLRDSMRTLGPFDIVFCRNVLIYFDQETKKKILEGIRGTLHNGGHLMLGGAETTLSLTDSFARVTVGQAVLYRVP
ncbi:MAG: protein-glutamate O-methyltransferase CheR [Bryobacterales bacterium]|nr:protein-glutamate O-methyltransferase CheR [Bryobacterales bacterium]